MTAYDTVTASLIVLVVVALIVWDVVLGAKKQRTESWWIARWARQFNAFPFAMGVLVGHWFMQNPNPDYRLYPAAITLAIVVLAYDLLCFPWPKGALLSPARWMRYPGLWLAFGVLAGHWLWPQRLP